jgi:hypothetical protein
LEFGQLVEATVKSDEPVSKYMLKFWACRGNSASVSEASSDGAFARGLDLRAFRPKQCRTILRNEIETGSIRGDLGTRGEGGAGKLTRVRRVAERQSARDRALLDAAALLASHARFRVVTAKGMVPPRLAILDADRCKSVSRR